MQITKLIVYLLISSFILIGCSDDDDNNLATNALQSGNKRPLGSSANDLLSATNFNSITIEIIAVQGFEPTTTAIQGFREFLQDRLFKPDGITITQRSIPSSGKAPFSIEEIAEIESTTRTLFNKEDDITVYVYFADGSKENDTNEQVTLGSAYLNTSMVIYEGTLRALSARPNSPSLDAIETATLNHEFSHLMGLVNIGTPLQSEHEDPDASNHCNVSSCLMEAAIEFGSGMMGMGDVIPELDAQCIADLQANGGR
ncbi:hypothetical protein ATE84_1919 [Aquimarina sp. MAR_2010_214]|uniref:hypothetical protein n=1 Tax=Aquimarina sp. MAR_2010_214 TaxID=1250026 RepID=UPI000C708733|nr:hypothetical protein [Aquimarina sp. MAR_2010_214]PKV49880.1 hypothetical protein ATE84_1919 [Aquimarina sp. MAR_2010_214]